MKENQEHKSRLNPTTKRLLGAGLVLGSFLAGAATEKAISSSDEIVNINATPGIESSWRGEDPVEEFTKHLALEHFITVMEGHKLVVTPEGADGNFRYEINNPAIQLTHEEELDDKQIVFFGRSEGSDSGEGTVADAYYVGMPGAKVELFNQNGELVEYTPSDTFQFNSYPLNRQEGTSHEGNAFFVIDIENYSQYSDTDPKALASLRIGETIINRS